MADSSPPAGSPPASRLSTLDPDALRGLLDVTRRMNAEVDPDVILGTIVDSLVSLARADRGFLMLKEGSGGLRFAVARDRKGKPLEETKFKVSQGVIDEVAKSGQTRLIDDAAASDAYNARMSIISLSLRTILCTPLTTPEGVIGLIYVDSNAITRRFTEGDISLIEAFAAQAAATIERVRLEQAERERDKMAAQLQVAAEIQRAFLPGDFPSLAGVQGAVASVAALHVGGDFYDVFPLPGGRVGVLVGDVSGKGVPGALFGARLMSDVRQQALLHDDAASTLTAVNEVVAARVTRGMFVTLIYAVLDPAAGSVRYANAGHLSPVVRRSSGELDEWEEPRSFPLGIVKGASYKTGEERLERGDVLLLLTDGLSDAASGEGHRFGDERVLQTIRDATGTPRAVVDSLLAATSAFTGDWPQADDQTLLAVGWA